MEDVDRIVQYGVPERMEDYDQKAGRGGRDRKAPCIVLVIAEEWAMSGYEACRNHFPSAKAARTDEAVYAFASLKKSCRRKFLCCHNNDRTAEGE